MSYTRAEFHASVIGVVLGLASVLLDRPELVLLLFLVGLGLWPVRTAAAREVARELWYALLGWLVVFLGAFFAGVIG